MSESPLFPEYRNLSMLPARAKEYDFNRCLHGPQKKSTKGVIMRRLSFECAQRFLFVGRIAGLVSWFIIVAPACAQTNNYEFNDSHFHLTNNVQQGPTIHDFLNMMGNKAGRVAVFGVPLQQQWSYRIDGDRAPTYYLHSDAPLYYYSFTDAWIAMAYKSLAKEQQARFDPMITGFNPTDMYAADHIRRVLETFPGVFTGIGEFTIHKEFVSAKIPGEVASLQNPALDRILDFAAEVGLVVILHNDIDIPIAQDVRKEESEPAYLSQIKAVFKRHPNVTIIWGHMGLGRLVAPPNGHLAQIESDLARPRLSERLRRYLAGRSCKIFCRQPGSDKGARRFDATLSGSFFVWYGFGRTDRSIQVSESLLSIRAFVEAARCGNVPQSSVAELRKSFR